ncbi:MAG: hypothetical protein GEU94_09660 [Micromonosporaceae bacterium]|nr:hypothetical protein [Micromonosporaceae bacterium]
MAQGGRAQDAGRRAARRSGAVLARRADLPPGHGGPGRAARHRGRPPLLDGPRHRRRGDAHRPVRHGHRPGRGRRRHAGAPPVPPGGRVLTGGWAPAAASPGYLLSLRSAVTAARPASSRATGIRNGEHDT